MYNNSIVIKYKEQEAIIKPSITRNLFPEFDNQKPFLKWAGGKTQLIPHLLKYIPKEFNKYIEPFVGAGALFFHLNYSRSIISDLNEELMITYEVVRDDIYSLINLLDSYVNEKSFYYNMRDLKPCNLSKVERAARFIYLNKTCFNGLYRVNKKGYFNVPYNNGIGKKYYDEKILLNASLSLKNTQIFHSDYRFILEKFAEENDLVFLNPPYHPISKNSDFKRYTKEFFYEDDQIELFKQFKILVEKGCFVILTNAAHQLIFDLYKDFRIETIETKRLISSNPNTRKGKDVIVIGEK